LKKSVKTAKLPAAASLKLASNPTLMSPSADLTWKAPKLPKGIVGPVEYELYITDNKSLKPGADGWTKISLSGEGVVATFTGDTAVTLNGLPPGTYYVYVKSIWSDDVVAFSNSGKWTIKVPEWIVSIDKIFRS
jgi:hypothetical protein